MTRLSPFMKLYCPDIDSLATNPLRLFIIMSKESTRSHSHQNLAFSSSYWSFSAFLDCSGYSLHLQPQPSHTSACLPARDGMQGRGKMYLNELQNRVENTLSCNQLYQQSSPKTSKNFFRQQLHWNHLFAQSQQCQSMAKNLQGKHGIWNTPSPMAADSNVHDFLREVPCLGQMRVSYMLHFVLQRSAPFPLPSYHTHHPLSTYQASPGLQNALNPTQPQHVSHLHPRCSLHRSRAPQTARLLGMHSTVHGHEPVQSSPDENPQSPCAPTAPDCSDHTCSLPLMQGSSSVSTHGGKQLQQDGPRAQTCFCKERSKDTPQTLALLQHFSGSRVLSAEQSWLAWSTSWEFWLLWATELSVWVRKLMLGEWSSQ